MRGKHRTEVEGGVISDGVMGREGTGLARGFWCKGHFLLIGDEKGGGEGDADGKRAGGGVPPKKVSESAGQKKQRLISDER